MNVLQVKLDYPDEFITSIHGYYGNINPRGANPVRSLSLESNKKTYGPFGVEQGTYFLVPMTGAKIVGFHGRCGWYLDSIGVYLKSLKQPNPSQNFVNSQGHITNTTESFGYSVIQGTVNQNYDIVLALRQKDQKGDFSKPIPNKVSEKISIIKESNSYEHKEKVPEKISMVKESNNYEHKEKVR